MKWKVEITRYQHEPEVVSTHRSLAAACRRLAHAIRAVRGLKEAWIRDIDGDVRFPLRTAQKIVKEDA